MADVRVSSTDWNSLLDALRPIIYNCRDIAAPCSQSHPSLMDFGQLFEPLQGVILVCATAGALGLVSQPAFASGCHIILEHVAGLRSTAQSLALRLRTKFQAAQARYGAARTECQILRGIFRSTPAQLAARAARYHGLNDQPWYSSLCAFFQEPEDPVQYRGSARCPPLAMSIPVMWYPSIESLRNGPEYGTHMWAYLNTEDNGELDLTPLKDMWGVDNCFPVDVTRLKLFVPRHRNKLSMMAVKVLTEGQDCLRIVERPSLITMETRRRQSEIAATSRQCLSEIGQGISQFSQAWQTFQTLLKAIGPVLLGGGFVLFLVFAAMMSIFATMISRVVTEVSSSA